MKSITLQPERTGPYSWTIPRTSRPGMLVEGRVYGSEPLVRAALRDGAFEQVANVATLPGILKASYAMPDIHRGYGFPIGGVAAFDLDDGVISPGGVGYDINCGVNLSATRLTRKDLASVIQPLTQQLHREIPAGTQGGDLRLSPAELRQLAKDGAGWLVKKGLATATDQQHMELRGNLTSADPDAVADRAYERARDQTGTLGSGNHFVEVQVVDRIYDPKAADILGLSRGMITIMIHSGSRGFGHQVCQDYLKVMQGAMSRYRIHPEDRQLACAPIRSDEGQRYLGAMACAANFAWANRLMLHTRVRRVFEKVLNESYDTLGIRLIYDVSHNMAHIENHIIEGKKRKVCVHRKGATRAFGPGSPDLPARYQGIGQPVLIPGDMGTASFILLGTSHAMEESFGSACHGAGRKLSRRAALKATKGRNLRSELEKQGIQVQALSNRTLGEEAPEAYKDIDDVIHATANVKLATKVARLVPFAVIKG